MDRPPVPFPSSQEGEHLHHRLCELDVTASADVCRGYRAPLLTWLARRHRAIDPDLVETAVHHALLGYFQRPAAFDPARLDLAAYLRMASRRDLLNLLHAEARHHRLRQAFSSVELDEERRNNSQSGETPLSILQCKEQAQRWHDYVQRMAVRLSKGDRLVLDLLLAGEKSTAVFAQALGLEAQPAIEQEQQVKWAKDRVLKRLARGGWRDD